jgi:hypothetical protein
VQVVLAGVAPEEDGRGWQAAVLAAFERHGEQWRRVVALGAMDLAPVAAADARLRAVGVDVGVDAARELAFASFVYGEPGGRRALITYRLDGRDRLSLVFDDMTPSATPPLWKARLRSDEAGDVAGPAGPAGLGYVVRTSARDAAALVGYRPFAVARERGETTLTPVVGATVQRPPVEGLELLLGRGAGLAAPGRAASLERCLGDATRAGAAKGRPLVLGDTAKLDLTSGCAPLPGLGQLTVAVGEDDAGRSESPQPVFVFGSDGIPVAYAALFAGESATAALAPGAYRLADTLSGRLLLGRDGAAPAALAADATVRVELAPRQSGRVRLTAPGGGPAVVVVQRFDRSAADAGVIAPPPPERASALGGGAFLVHRWPFELTLLTGGYDMQVASGPRGAFCRVRWVVREGQPQEVICPKAPVDAGASPDAWTFADLAFDGTAYGDPNTYKTAAGVDWLVAPAGSPQAADLAQARNGWLPGLRVEDPATGQALSLVPATPNLRAGWREATRRHPPDPLGAFARFVRERNASGLLELSCPPPGASPDELARQLKRLAPDALRVVGCATGPATTDVLAVVGQVTAQRGSPLLLTAVPALDYAPYGPYLPRLTLRTADLGRQSPLAGFVQALKRGRYGVGSGAALAVSDPVAKSADEVQVTVEYALAAGVTARYVDVYTERGLLRRHMLPPTAQSAAAKPSGRGAAEASPCALAQAPESAPSVAAGSDCARPAADDLDASSLDEPLAAAPLDDSMSPIDAAASEAAGGSKPPSTPRATAPDARASAAAGRRIAAAAAQVEAPAPGRAGLAIQLPHDAVWLRLELRGTVQRPASGPLLDPAGQALLATTNFFAAHPAPPTAKR